MKKIKLSFLALIMLLSTNSMAFTLGDIDYPFGIVVCTTPSGQHLWAVVVTDEINSSVVQFTCFWTHNVPTLIRFP